MRMVGAWLDRWTVDVLLHRDERLSLQQLTRARWTLLALYTLSACIENIQTFREPDRRSKEDASQRIARLLSDLVYDLAESSTFGALALPWACSCPSPFREQSHVPARA